MMQTTKAFPTADLSSSLFIRSGFQRLRQGRITQPGRNQDCRIREATEDGE